MQIKVCKTLSITIKAVYFISRQLTRSLIGIIWAIAIYLADTDVPTYWRNAIPPFNRYRLQFKMPAPQERRHTDKLSRGEILGREVTSVSRVESVVQRQIRARHLHVNEVIHRHARRRQCSLHAVQ